MVLDDALEELSTLSQRQHDIVMLHFYGGLKFTQIKPITYDKTTRGLW